MLFNYVFEIFTKLWQNLRVVLKNYDRVIDKVEVMVCCKVQIFSIVLKIRMD